MKVLLIDDNYHFLGGDNSLLNREKRFLEERGHETMLFSWGKEKIEAAGIIVAEEPHSRWASKIRKFFFPGYLKAAFRKVLMEFQPDVIHLHLVAKYPLSVYPLLRGFKSVQTLHGPSLFCASSWGCLKDGNPCPLGIGWKCYRNKCLRLYQTLPYLYLEKKTGKALENVTVFHCPSKNIYNTAFRLGYRNLAYVPLGIGHIFENRAIGADNKRRKDVLFVGSMAEVKGVSYLYQAFKMVLKMHPDARLLMVGRGEYCEIIKNDIKKDGLENKVLVLGTVTPDRVAELCLQSSVMAVPSIWQEQFGMVGPEALSMKLPVVGSMVGGIPEWLHHNEWGFLVPPRNVEELSKHISYLLAHREIIERFGNAGREFVLKEYSNRRYLENLSELLERTALGESYDRIN